VLIDGGLRRGIASWSRNASCASNDYDKEVYNGDIGYRRVTVCSTVPAPAGESVARGCRQRRMTEG
jgi:hypothetical protein